MDTLYTTEYDASLKAIPHICWLPWIGENYRHAQKRLLVVGHSYKDGGVAIGEQHETPNEQGREWKAEHIRNHAKGMYQSKYHFPDAIDGILTGRGKLRGNELRRIPVSEMRALWGIISFTNFIQNITGNDSKPEIIKSQSVLSDICEQIQPTHICMFARAKQSIASWPYVKDRQPEILQTPHPTGRGEQYYDRQAELFQATIDSWGILTQSME